MNASVVFLVVVLAALLVVYVAFVVSVRQLARDRAQAAQQVTQERTEAFRQIVAEHQRSTEAQQAVMLRVVDGASQLAEAASKLVAPPPPHEPTLHDLLGQFVGQDDYVPGRDPLDQIGAEFESYGDPRVGGLRPGEQVMPGIERED